MLHLISTSFCLYLSFSCLGNASEYSESFSISESVNSPYGLVISGILNYKQTTTTRHYKKHYTKTCTCTPNTPKMADSNTETKIRSYTLIANSPILQVFNIRQSFPCQNPSYLKFYPARILCYTVYIYVTINSKN